MQDTLMRVLTDTVAVVTDSVAKDSVAVVSGVGSRWPLLVGFLVLVALAVWGFSKLKKSSGDYTGGTGGGTVNTDPRDPRDGPPAQT